MTVARSLAAAIEIADSMVRTYLCGCVRGYLRRQMTHAKYAYTPSVDWPAGGGSRQRETKKELGNKKAVRKTATAARSLLL